jgi:hypothetical protein
MTDREVIATFVAFRAATDSPGLKVDRWPEDEEDREIDAVAGDLAIEHTSIDTLSDQRGRSAPFQQMATSLESEFSGLPFSLRVVIEYDAVRKGSRWPAIGGAIREWTVLESSAMPEGTAMVVLPEVKFQMRVTKEPAASAIGRGLRFVRSTPTNDVPLLERLRRLCDRKVRKLAPWQSGQDPKKTLLLLESNDIALMSEVKMTEAVREAYPDGRPAGVDQLWYANTTGQAWPEAEFEFLDLSEMWSKPLKSSARWRAGRSAF